MNRPTEMNRPTWKQVLDRKAGVLVCAFAFTVTWPATLFPRDVFVLVAKPSCKKTIDDPIAKVLRLIEQCPGWTRIESDDHATRQEVIACLGTIAASDTAVIRQAIQQFESQVESQQKYDTDDLSKIFLLNRYLFNVPANSSRQDARFFGGWCGVPDDDKNVDLLWPFKKNSNNKLDLVGKFGGYMGEPFQAVKEFDYFNKRFGRRKQH